METTWQVIIILMIIVTTSTFILYTGNTVYCLLSLISLVLALSWFLIYAGLELIGFMLSTIYLGAILVFFIFVIMLIDLRFEDLQELYDDARAYEPQDFTIIYPITIVVSMLLLDLLVERVLYEEYFGMEFFILPEDVNTVVATHNISLNLLSEYFVAHSTSPAAIGFYLFSTEGASVGVLTLLILFSLYVSLYTVQSANEEVLDRRERANNKNDKEVL